MTFLFKWGMWNNTGWLSGDPKDQGVLIMDFFVIVFMRSKRSLRLVAS
jgi:hypothetical protein